MSTINITGLMTGSAVDTDQIITQLTRFNEQRISILQVRVDEAVQRQTAFKQLEAKMLSLQGTAQQLTRTRNGIFDSKTATSSDETVLQVAAGSSAQPGQYTLRVLSLAANHQLASQGFDTATSEITQGTFTIGTVSGSSKTITIDATNNTLQGLAQAINNADVGVTATVISDGSDARTQPYRLLLSADVAGTANAISITNNLAPPGSGTALRPTFEPPAPNAAGSIGPAVTATSFQGTAPVYSTGTYTGTTNRTFRFEVTQGGVVGTDTVEISVTDGSNTGTITIAPGDAGVAKDLPSWAKGVQVQVGSGGTGEVLNTGDRFTIDAFVHTVQQAANAQVRVGSGDGAITVESSTNQVQNLIPGVTLNLQSAASPTKPITITVADDTTMVKQKITDLVDNFNDVMDFVNEQVRYDASTGVAGTLNGNNAVIAMQNAIRQAIVAVSTLLPVGINRLGALGIAVTQGRLQINQAVLDAMISGGEGGMDMAELQQLVGLSGTSTNPQMEFVAASLRTKEGAYGVDVTQAAEQASLTAADPLAGSTTIDATNKTLSLTLDGQAFDVALTEGTYTRADLAKELETRINAEPDLNGRQVAVSVSSDDKLEISSQSYGTASEVTVTGGTSLGTLGLGQGQSARGRDVAGSFIVQGAFLVDGQVVNEKSETATGRGQFLVGDATNENTADLDVQVTLTPSQVQSGSDGTMTVARGVAARLDAVLNQFLDPVSGRLKAINDKFQKQIDDANSDIQVETKEMDDRKSSLMLQFAAMENTMNRLIGQSDLISNQLQSLLVAKSGKSGSATK
jgi:flagellar hook-associated protein 2